MIELLICVLWAFISYHYAKEVKNQHPNIDIEPTNYIIGGFLFGLLSVLWCGWKHFKYVRKYK